MQLLESYLRWDTSETVLPIGLLLSRDFGRGFESAYGRKIGGMFDPAFCADLDMFEEWHFSMAGAYVRDTIQRVEWLAAHILGRYNRGRQTQDEEATARLDSLADYVRRLIDLRAELAEFQRTNGGYESVPYPDLPLEAVRRLAHGTRISESEILQEIKATGSLAAFDHKIYPLVQVILNETPEYATALIASLRQDDRESVREQVRTLVVMATTRLLRTSVALTESLALPEPQWQRLQGLLEAMAWQLFPGDGADDTMRSVCRSIRRRRYHTEPSEMLGRAGVALGALLLVLGALATSGVAVPPLAVIALSTVETGLDGLAVIAFYGEAAMAEELTQAQIVDQAMAITPAHSDPNIQAALFVLSLVVTVGMAVRATARRTADGLEEGARRGRSSMPTPEEQWQKTRPRHQESPVSGAVTQPTRPSPPTSPPSAQEKGVAEGVPRGATRGTTKRGVDQPETGRGTLETRVGERKRTTGTRDVDVPFVQRDWPKEFATVLKAMERQHKKVIKLRLADARKNVRRVNKELERLTETRRWLDVPRKNPQMRDIARAEGVLRRERSRQTGELNALLGRDDIKRRGLTIEEIGEQPGEVRFDALPGGTDMPALDLVRPTAEACPMFIQTKSTEYALRADDTAASFAERLWKGPIATALARLNNKAQWNHFRERVNGLARQHGWAISVGDDWTREALGIRVAVVSRPPDTTTSEAIIAAIEAYRARLQGSERLVISIKWVEVMPTTDISTDALRAMERMERAALQLQTRQAAAAARRTRVTEAVSRSAVAGTEPRAR